MPLERFSQADPFTHNIWNVLPREGTCHKSVFLLPHGDKLHFSGFQIGLADFYIAFMQLSLFF